MTSTDLDLNTTIIWLYNSSNVLINSSNSSSSPLFINFTNLADGTYHINASANDSTGNVNSTTTRSILLDTTYSTWENNKTNLTNLTLLGSTVYFNITFNDTNANQYTFSWYNGTNWTNNSVASYTNGQEIEIIKNTTTSLGDINWTWYFNDTAGNSNQSDIWSVSINSMDSDNDGLLDIADPLWYNESNVTNSGVTSLNITVGGNTTEGIFNEIQEMNFYDETTLMINFSHNFTQSVLDLSNITITKTATSLIVDLSSQLQSSYNKTIYITDDSFITLCVKDEEISSISEMSSGCTGSNETDFTSCLGGSLSSGGINCTDLGSTIKVDNLQYSAIRGTQASSSSSSSSSSSEGSSSGGGSCPPGTSLIDRKCQSPVQEEEEVVVGEEIVEEVVVEEIVEEVVVQNEDESETKQSLVGMAFGQFKELPKTAFFAMGIFLFLLLSSLFFFILYKRRQEEEEEVQRRPLASSEMINEEFTSRRTVEDIKEDVLRIRQQIEFLKRKCDCRENNKLYQIYKNALYKNMKRLQYDLYELKQLSEKR
ncbi:hypothetical protein HOC01_01625 [archaeon]|nr:hypothetical protein [archaeon]MBT6697981.1 hypothetical protein [archaeon]